MIFVSMKWVFVIAGVVSLGCIAVTGYLLAANTTATTEDLVLRSGESQVRTAMAKIHNHMKHLESTCDFFGAYFTKDLGHLDISNPELVVKAFNETFFNLSVRYLQSPGSQMGITMTFLYPPYVHPKTQYNTMQALNDWGGHSPKGDDPSRLLTYTYTLPDGKQNVAWSVDVNGKQPRIVKEAYRFSQRQYYIDLENSDYYWDRIWPWTAADGSHYMFLTYQRTFQLQGVPVLVQSLELIAEWYDLLVSSLNDSSLSSHLIVVDNFGQLVASSLDSGLNLSCEYVFDAANFIACDPMLALDSPKQLIRDMYHMASFLGKGQTSVKGQYALGGTEYFYVVQELINTGNLTLTVVWVRTRVAAMGSILDAQLLILAVGCGLTALTSATLAFLAIWGLLQPLNRIVETMGKVRTLDIEHCRGLSERSCIRELRHMQVEFGAMMNTIISFTKYVPKQVVRDMMSSGEGLAQLGMKHYEITILFLDIVDFPEMCEKVEPEGLSALTEIFFTQLSNIVLKHCGTVDKYIGDAVMCLWGAPLACDAPQLRACCAALAMRHVVCHQLHMYFKNKGVEALDIRIGIHSGPALCGNLGGADHMCFTATGDSVNAAARMVNFNQQFGTSILVSDVVQRSVHRMCVCRYLGLANLGPSGARTPMYTIHGMVDGSTLASGSGDDPSASHPKSQSVADCITDLLRLRIFCPRPLIESVNVYSLGVRRSDEGHFPEAVQAFQSCQAVLSQLLAEPSDKWFPRDLPQPPVATLQVDTVAISPTSCTIPPATLEWVIGSLPRHCEERLEELAKSIKA